MRRWSDAVDRYFSSSTNRTNLFALSKQLHSQTDPSTPTHEHYRLISALSPAVHASIDHSHTQHHLHNTRAWDRSWRLGSLLRRVCQVVSAVICAWLRGFPITLIRWSWSELFIDWSSRGFQTPSKNPSITLPESTTLQHSSFKYCYERPSIA